MHSSFSLFCSLLALAALSDLLQRKIPNRLNLLIFTFSLIVRFWESGWGGVVQGLAGAGLAFALLFPFFVLRWYGAGDVKLMSAGGAYLGLSETGEALLLGTSFGGILALAQVALMRSEQRRRVFSAIASLMTPAPSPSTKETMRDRFDHTPMALAFAAAMIVSPFWKGPFS